MTIADQARNAAITLEAKKDALTQKQSGDWKVSFTVQGIDMDPRLTQAAMGTRYAMVLVEIGDDELPVPAKESIAKAPAPPPKLAGANADKRDWREMKPSAQAAIRCGEATFWAFLNETEEYRYVGHVADKEQAAGAVREICEVTSRAHLDLPSHHLSRVLWNQLDQQFQAWKALERA